MKSVYTSVKSETRIQWLDFVRTIAILCVLLCHSTESIYKMNITVLNTMSLYSKLAAFVCFTIGRIGVPLFFMSSGYLLLDRDYNEVTCRKFWKDKWSKLLVCTLIWWVIYEVFLYFYVHQPISLSVLLSDMLFIHKINMSHVWYMPVLLGLYILIPYVAKALKGSNLRMLCFPIVFFTIFSFIFPVIKEINVVLNLEPLSLQMSLGFSGGAYGLYLIYGYLVKSGVFKKINTLVMTFVTLLFFALTVLFQFWCYKNNCQYNVWYDNAFLMICSVSLFELMSRIKKIHYYDLFQYVARYSFGIYLVHNMIRIPCAPIVSALPIPHILQVSVLSIILFLLSLLGVSVIAKIPKIGNYLLYLK